MALTKEQAEAASNLLVAYPGGCGFNPDNREALAVYDSLVAQGIAVALTEVDIPEFTGGQRAYVLSDQAAEAYSQLVQEVADRVALN